MGISAQRIVGMELAEGRALIARLIEWTAQPNFTYVHKWQEGDLVIWDNHGTMHRATPYATDSGRMMHRTMLGSTETLH
jgi:alpha-ketoglutarate-dependent taurine dioxygenase